MPDDKIDVRWGITIIVSGLCIGLHFISLLYVKAEIIKCLINNL